MGGQYWLERTEERQFSDLFSSWKLKGIKLIKLIRTVMMRDTDINVYNNNRFGII